MLPPAITATNVEGLTITVTLADTGLDAPCRTDRMILYGIEEVRLKGANTNFDGSREVDEMDPNRCEPNDTVQLYARPRVDIEPSQLETKAFEAKDNDEDLVTWTT